MAVSSNIHIVTYVSSEVVYLIGHLVSSVTSFSLDSLVTKAVSLDQNMDTSEFKLSDT